MADEWLDIEDRERRLGIPPGQPILMSAGLVDYRLGDYFRSAFAVDRGSTAMTYAKELRTWFSFLETRAATWDAAQRGDIRAFQVWRVYDERNVGAVSPATWNKGWAALRHFYGWAHREGWLEVNPVGDQERLRDPSATGGHREKNARSSRDRWITPIELAMWREVGLRGYSAAKDESGRVVAALPDQAARARNTARNVAFVDYLATTGLRLSEAGALLNMEIPDRVGGEAPIIGKGGKRRHYRVMHQLGLDGLHSYRAGERRDAIRRAQQAGRYEDARDRLMVVEALDDRAGQRVRLADGRVADVTRMSVNDRARLFVEGLAGPEPAWLWLTEAGTPMPPPSWEKVFDAGNGRVSKARAGLGIASPWVKVTPHTLRFTFALFVLLAGARAIDERLGIGAADVFLIRNYTQAFDEVRDLLGHSSGVTTERIYLEPVKGLRRSSLLRGGSLAEMWDGLVTANPLVGFRNGA